MENLPDQRKGFGVNISFPLPTTFLEHINPWGTRGLWNCIALYCHPDSCLDCISGIFTVVLFHISFYFLILLDLNIYFTFKYPVIFLWLFSALSLSFFPLIYSRRVQDFVLTLTFLHVCERLHPLTEGVSTSVSEFESCVHF